MRHTTIQRTTSNRNERGIALVIALFALLLLSAIGLGLMYSSSTETTVNSNFRDKQNAAYGSMSGALEARDRLQPSGDIASPVGLPSTSTANVIYIINPYGGETVAPWDYTNKYADTELCHENILGLSGTAGLACGGSSSLPSGSSWYTVKDDSSSSSFGTGFSAYQQSVPFSYKWTRISLKTDNMTPVNVNGSSASGNQVCWDGAHEVVLNYSDPTCAPTGAVTGITLTSAGNGYNSTPHITIAAPPSGGTQATATANMTSTSTGSVISGAVTDGGSGYTSAPTVTITGDGTGATASAVVQLPGSPVASVTGLSTPAASTACYTAAPSVSFSPVGGATAASATAVLDTTTSCIYAISTTSNSGSCSYKNTTANFQVSNGGGSGFVGQLTFDNNKKIGGWTVITPGTSYTSTPTTLTGLSSCSTNPTITFTMGYHVKSVTVTSGGGGYTTAPAVTIAAPANNNGTVQTATANLGAAPANAGQITGIVVNNGGSGYTSAAVTFGTDGGGTGAAGTITLGNMSPKNTISSITITNAGSGYTADPTVTFTGGGGSGATATATISSGTYYGRVYLITSYAQTPSGSKSMTQMEVASAVRSFALAGALTLDGPSPTFGSPSSNNFQVLGADANSCGETAAATKPSIGVYDNPNQPTSPTAQSSVTSALGKPQNYIGSKPAPDVENVYGALGQEMTTPKGMEALANAIAGMSGANTYTGSTSSINMGSSSTPVVNVVNGDLSLSGNNHGYGILLVRGNLTMSGNFSWNGPIFVIGKGVFNSNGGGNGQITGMIWVAKTKDSSGNLLSALGSPTLSWSGGGGNGIQYDHCWADNLVNTIHFTPPQPTTPLKILSTRTVTF